MAHALANPIRSLAGLVDELQRRGRYTFTRLDVRKALPGLSDVAIEGGLRRLRERRRIATPRRGFHVVVPVEYSDAGCPPAPWFIDDFMCHLGQPYYVGLLSAAAIHGAAHQQPMVFQVVTDRPTRPALAGRSRIVFHRSRAVPSTPIVQVQTETGSMRVSTPEATAFDVVRLPDAAGGPGNVATVLAELAERCSGAALLRVAQTRATPDVQRLGYFLDHVGESARADVLARWLSGQRHRPVLLAPGRPARRAKPDQRWRVRPNVEVEAEA